MKPLFSILLVVALLILVASFTCLREPMRKQEKCDGLPLERFVVYSLFEKYAKIIELSVATNSLGVRVYLIRYKGEVSESEALELTRDIQFALGPLNNSFIQLSDDAIEWEVGNLSGITKQGVRRLNSP